MELYFTSCNLFSFLFFFYFRRGVGGFSDKTAMC